MVEGIQCREKAFTSVISGRTIAKDDKKTATDPGKSSLKVSSFLTPMMTRRRSWEKTTQLSLNHLVPSRSKPRNPSSVSIVGAESEVGKI